MSCARWEMFDSLSSVSYNYRMSPYWKQEDYSHEAKISRGIERIFRKHAYSNILKILSPKNEKFQIKILIFFIFLLKT